MVLVKVLKLKIRVGHLFNLDKNDKKLRATMVKTNFDIKLKSIIGITLCHQKINWYQLQITHVD